MTPLKKVLYIVCVCILCPRYLLPALVFLAALTLTTCAALFISHQALSIHSSWLVKGHKAELWLICILVGGIWEAVLLVNAWKKTVLKGSRMKDSMTGDGEGEISALTLTCACWRYTHNLNCASVSYQTSWEWFRARYIPCTSLATTEWSFQLCMKTSAWLVFGVGRTIFLAEGEAIA